MAVTLTSPAEWDGLVQRTWASLTTLTLVAAEPPNETLDVPVRFVPESVQAVPPEVTPPAGEMLDSIGVSANG